MTKKRIAIIGAGLGGLSAATHLCSHSEDYEITIFERNNTSGGKVGEYCKDGYRFDTGPSLLTMPTVFEKIIADAGVEISTKLELVRLDPICKYFFPNGTTLLASHDIAAFQSEVGKISASDAQALPQYLNYSRTMYEYCAPLFLEGDIWDTFKMPLSKAIQTLLQVYKIDPFRTMHQSISRTFHSPQIQQLFGRYATYSGSSPFRAPATLNLIPHVEYNLGSYYIRGGIRQLVNALHEALSLKGVHFCYQTHIARVVSRQHAYFDKPHIVGVQDSQGNLFHCDAAICNADVVWAHRNLLHSPKFQNSEPSTSGMVFLWGIEGGNYELQHHNIFFSADYRSEFLQLADQQFPEDPTIYINISSKTDPQDAPQNCENWFVMVNTPALQPTGELPFSPSEVRKIILRRLGERGFPELEGRIRVERILSPKDFQDNHLSNRGSIYGISSNTRGAAFLRQPSTYNKMKGFFFAGGSAHPGGGMPLVALSGGNAARAARRYLCSS
jgi:phytoene desaturase